MSISFKSAVFCLATLALVFTGGNTADAGYMFSIDNITITPGNGIGIDPGVETNGNGNLLGIDHTVAALPVDAELTNAGDFYTFTAGTISFNPQETFINGTESQNNVGHNLDFTIVISFTAPTGTVQNLTLFGNASANSVSDTAVDYSLSFGSPVQVNFGVGGIFSVSVSDIALTQGLPQTADFLVKVSLDTPTVPEPTSIALLGIGAAGLGLKALRRRKNQK